MKTYSYVCETAKKVFTPWNKDDTTGTPNTLWKLWRGRADVGVGGCGCGADVGKMYSGFGGREREEVGGEDGVWGRERGQIWGGG